MNRAEAERIVDKILYDLSDRRGLKREWAACDADIQAEIREAWIAILMEETSQEPPSFERQQYLVELLSKLSILRDLEQQFNLTKDKISAMGKIAHRDFVQSLYGVYKRVAAQAKEAADRFNETFKEE